jgi:HK97 family phage portal protein
MAFFKKLSMEKRAVLSDEMFLETYLENGFLDIADILDEEALRNSDIYTAVRIISSDIAGLNIKVLNKNQEEFNEDLNYLLNVKPNANNTAYSFKFSLVANAFLNGNGYAHIIRDKQKKPQELRILKSSNMTATIEKGKLIYKYNGDVILKEDILHFKFFTVNGITGISPLFSLVKEVEMLNSGNSALLSFFRNGVKGSGILKVKSSNLNKEAKDKIRAKFEESNAGNNNALKTIILDETMEYTPLEINTKVLELVNNNKYSTTQIAKAFGISKDRFGQETPNTSINDANAIYLQNTLKNYLISIEQEITLKLIEYPLTKTYKIIFDTSTLFNKTELEEYEIAIKGITGSLLTINEARAKIKLPPIENGDKLLQSLNFKEVDENLKDTKKGGD